jgi:serine/threonine protein kinase
VCDVQVLTHIAARLIDLHAAGYVHRDIKPGNIMWLPRKKRWTIIDFGCAARTGEYARLGFSLFYAAPEVLVSHESGAPGIVVTEALDAWSLGILAIEMFTGQPVFDLLQPEQKVRGPYLPQRQSSSTSFVHRHCHSRVDCYATMPHKHAVVT